MKKYFILLFIVLLLIPTICIADVAGSYSRSSIGFEITVPKVGDKPSNTVTPNSNGISVSNVRWVDSSGKQLKESDTFSSGTYKVFVDVTRTGGDSFRSTMSIYVNNSTDKVEKVGTSSANFVSFSWTCEVARAQSSGRVSNVTGGKASYLETPDPIQSIEFTYTKPAYGNKPAQISDISWTKTYDTALEITDLYWVRESTGKRLTSTDTYEEGAYIIHLFIKLKYDYVLADDAKIIFNGYSAVHKKLEDGSFDCYMRSSVTKPKEETTTTSISEKEKEEIIAAIVEKRPDVIATLPSTSTLMPINKSGDTITETKPATTSGEAKPVATTSEETKSTTTSGETKKEEKTETTSKITWASASAWAIDELNKANELGVIPAIFDKGDLTKNISRKEFAHVAVKLYEKVSGQKAVAVANNPFADTKDEEILKAYNVGITNGTSETTFEPDALITREQMATMMTRALAKAGKDTSVDMSKVTKFADDDKMHDWGKSAIYYMSSIEIIKGVGENTYDVLGNATREQALLISERSALKFAK